MGISAGLTLIIFLVWLSIFSYTLSNSTVITKKNESPPSPLENLRGSALDGLIKLQTQFNDAKQKINFISDEYQKAIATGTIINVSSSGSPTATTTGAE